MKITALNRQWLSDSATPIAASDMGSDDTRKFVSLLLTDRFGAVGASAFEDAESGQRAFNCASMCYAHVLYTLQDGAASEGEEVVIGEERWGVTAEYGLSSGVSGIKARARRFLAAVSSGHFDSLGGDISREHLARISPSGAFRAATLPLRLSGSAAKALARQKLGPGPKRPTWNAAYEAAVTVLRSAAQNVPRSISVMRFFTDVSIPGAFLPIGALRCVDPVRWRAKDGKLETQQIEWIWPRELTPELSASPLSYACELSKKFSETSLAPLLRERLRDVPVILYFHGGAFALCGRGTHRELTFRLSLAAHAVVCVPEYRRPPDAALAETTADAERAYDRVLSYGVDPSRIVFAGDSAGGGLALSLLRSLRDAGKQLPAASLLFSPWVDLDEEDHSDLAYKSRNSNQKFDFLPRDLIDLFSAATVANEQQQQHSRPSCMFFRRCGNASELAGLPPCLVHVGQCEVLHDQVVSMVRQAKLAGGSIDLVVWRDMVHVSPCFAAFHDTPRQQLRMAGAFVRAVACGQQRPIFLQIEAIAALRVPLGGALLLSPSTAYLAARLPGERDWAITDACRSAVIGEDGKTANLDWGANGSNVTLSLGPLHPDVVEAGFFELQIGASTKPFGSTVLLSTNALIPDRQDAQPGLLNLTVASATVLVSVCLVRDDSFVVPTRLTVDPDLLRDPKSTQPAALAPIIQLPTRIRLPPSPAMEQSESPLTRHKSASIETCVALPQQSLQSLPEPLGEVR